MDYYEYIKSERWKSVKRAKIALRQKKGNYECFVCGEKEGLSVRIINYHDDMMKTTTLDVRVLCPRCAEVFYWQRKRYGKLLSQYGVYSRSYIQRNMARLELGIETLKDMKKRKKTKEFLAKARLMEEQLTLA